MPLGRVSRDRGFPRISKDLKWRLLVQHNTLSVVIPAYNEANNIDAFLDRLVPVLTETRASFEVIFVDDGSSDDTAERINAARHRFPMVKLIRLSRNFGKEAALNAGLGHASGDAVIQIDADLQHPPEKISEFVEAWRSGGQIVYGQRQSRDNESALRRLLARSFYRVFAFVSRVQLMEGLGDFVLMDRKVVDALLSLPERERFTKGLYAWVGFQRVAIPYHTALRADGVSGWKLRTLFSFAMDAITAFGSFPLKVWSYVGLLMAIPSLGYGSYMFLRTLLFGNDVPGYPSLIVAICFFSGVQLIGLGVIGEYLSRVLAEVKLRPLYLVQERIGFEDEQNEDGNLSDNVRKLAS